MSDDIGNSSGLPADDAVALIDGRNDHSVEIVRPHAIVCLFETDVLIDQRVRDVLRRTRLTGREARLVREKLCLTPTQLAVELNSTPAALVAWEEGRTRVPRHIAADLAWRGAIHERQAALAASGLPQCDWMTAFEQQSAPTDLEQQSDRLALVVAHEKTCELCAAREAFIAERFPPMPPAPRRGVPAIVVPIAERIQTLPRWAQAPATGAVLFVAYSLLKLVFLLPGLARRGWAGLLTAAEGIAVSAALGALVGLLYDFYRQRRDAASSPEKRGALEFLDAQMAELRAKGVGGGALRDAYLRQRRAVLKGRLTLAELQQSANTASNDPPNAR